MSMLSRTLTIEDEIACFHIPTGCLELDKLLNGGIASQSVTEVFGASGCGKTQFSIELMLNTLFSEINGNVIYISTKECLTPESIKGKIERLVTLTNKTNVDKDVLVQKYLRRILYKRVVNLYDLIFAVYHASETVDRSYYRTPFKLVIVDSLTYFFRNQHVFERERISDELMTILEYLATKFNCAVLITTDMSADINAKKGMSQLKSMLGDTFASRASKRIELNRNPTNNHVCAVIQTHDIELMGSMAFYQVDETTGIIDLVIKKETKSEENELSEI